MSAESLYEALHATVSEQLQLDDPLSTLEVVGALEMVKHDLIQEFNAALENDDDDPEPASEACGMPAAA